MLYSTGSEKRKSKVGEKVALWKGNLPACTTLRCAEGKFPEQE